ncbi:MAG: sugar transferase [Pseudomonadota bacterium]
MEYIQSLSISDRREAPKRWTQAVADYVSRIRFQLLGGVLVSVLVPAFVRARFERISDLSINYEHTLIGTLSALLLGYLIFRKMTVLPGAKAIVNVVPAFLTSYAVVVAVFFLMRIDYSRAQFLLSFGLTCIWFAAILMVMARFRRPIFAVLPGADYERLQSYKGIRWTILKNKKVLTQYPHIPIIVDFRAKSINDEWQRVIAEEAIKGRRVLSARELTESLTGRVQIEYLSQNSFGHLSPDSLYAPAKRYVDIVSAMCVTAFLWPVLLLTAIAVRLESKGPAIFKQTRMGFQGRTFTVYKFRSMRVQKENEGDLQSDKTQSDDARITRVGRLIRNTRIDELPQIFNILKGDMSWIGPRPETLRLSKWYEQEIPFYRYRHIVRPGVSGWAQVKQGHVTEVEDIRQKLEFDMYYVKNFSVWLDLLIVVKTLAVIVTGRGAR